MERKSFQIVMQPSAQKRAKIRAGQLNITIGRHIENLISAMEIRLERAYKIGKAENMLGLIDDRFLKVLLQADQKGWDQKKLEQKLKDTVIEAENENIAFSPSINLGSRLRCDSCGKLVLTSYLNDHDSKCPNCKKRVRMLKAPK